MTRAAKKKTGKKKTPAKTPVGIRPQEHGGALRSGGTNKGGTGRPPSVIRENLRGSFADRVAVIESIADGAPIQHIRVPLIAVLPHVVCPNCGEQEMHAVDGSAALEFDAEASASPRDRLAALDLQAKYGLGTTKDVSIEHVRERVQRTIDVLRARLDPGTLEAVLADLKPIWQ